MKKNSGRLGDTVMTLLLLGIGAALLYGSIWNSEVGQIIADMMAIPIAAAGLGGILILSVILRWVGGFSKRKDSFIDFPSEEGSVGISTNAICDFIERIGKEFSAVKSVQSRLTTSKGAVDIQLNVKVASGNKIPELSQVLQRRVRESVRESLGLDEIRNITIQVQEIVGEPTNPSDTSL